MSRLQIQMINRDSNQSSFYSSNINPDKSDENKKAVAAALGAATPAISSQSSSYPLNPDQITPLLNHTPSMSTPCASPAELPPVIQPLNSALLDNASTIAQTSLGMAPSEPSTSLSSDDHAHASPLPSEVSTSVDTAPSEPSASLNSDDRAAIAKLKHRLKQEVDLTPEDRKKLGSLNRVLNNVLRPEVAVGHQYKAKVLPIMGMAMLIVAVAVGCFLNLPESQG